MNKLLIHLIALAMVVISLASTSHAACPQPVYIIAHRCNQAGEVSEVVKQQGVNAVEADFSYNLFSKTWWVEHDDIDSDSTPLGDWLNDVEDTINDVEDATAESDTLALVIFDIKTPIKLLSLYNKARDVLGPDINLIFSIGDFGTRASFLQFRDALNQDPRAGAAIDYLVGGESQVDVQNFFLANGITDYWFADGITAFLPTPLSVLHNVSAGLNLRDISLQSCGDRFHGVYTWTYEQADSITRFLSKAGLLEYPFQIAGVNGIFMNTMECYVPWASTAWEPKEAVAFAKLAQPLTGTKFADRKHNPFEVPAPEITCPPDTIIECSSPGGVDRDDSQLDAFFGGAIIDTRGCNAVSDAEVDAPEFFFLDEQAPVIFTAADEGVCRPSSSCAADVTVVDTIEPIITKITATPDMLWPPNGKIVPVNIDVVSADICDTGPVCQIASVTSNEPEGRLGSRSHSSDWRITEGLGLELRAERSGRGDGRIYTITVECADASGNRAQGTVAVGVPHDQR